MDCGLWVGGSRLLIRGLLWVGGSRLLIRGLLWCVGVIFVVVWQFACSISKKREKKIEMMMLYMMNILL